MNYLFSSLVFLWNIFALSLASYLLVSFSYGVIEDSFLRKDLSYEKSSALKADLKDPSKKNEKSVNPEDYTIIYKKNFFGTLEKESGEEKKAASIDIKELKPTSLKLSLLGTIASDKRGAAFAVIEDKDKKSQELYTLGDKVQGATLSMIFRHKVVLNHRGKDEVLEMEIKEGSLPEIPMEDSSSSEKHRLSRKLIDESLQNINELMRHIRVSANFEDGQAAGLRVDRLASGSIFQELGLKNGDVIKGVNGKDIKSVEDALSFYQELKSASSVSLQIERKKSPLTLSYTIR